MAAEIGSLIRNPLLTNMLFRFKTTGMIGRDVVPIAPVPARVFRVTTLNEAPFRIPNGKTGPRGKVAQIEIDALQTQFAVDDCYLEEPVDRIEQREASFDRLSAAQDFIQANLDLIYEKDVADLLQTQANYAAGFFSTPGILWSTPATAIPLNNILVACETLLAWPTDIIFGQQAWTQFCLTEQVGKVFGILGGNTTAPSNVTPAMVASYFGVQRVHVGRVKYNSAVAGATDVFSFIWGKHCMVLHQNKMPRTDVVTHSFSASETQADSMTTFAKDPGPKGADFVRAGWNYKLVLKAQKYGYLLESVAA